jgi:hypothetical protein
MILTRQSNLIFSRAPLAISQKASLVDTPPEPHCGELIVR